MAVEVRLPTLLRPAADGAASVTAEGATVGEVFAALTTEYPALAGQLVDDSGALHTATSCRSCPRSRVADLPHAPRS